MAGLLKDWPKDWTKVPDFEAQDILYEKKYFRNGGVARITFCHEVRPGLNAARTETIMEFRDALIDANHDNTVGVVVLQGAGDKSFLAGGDMNWETTGGLLWEFDTGEGDIQRHMRRCRKPIIASVRGYCIAAGNHWAYFCDMTLAADNAIFGQNGPRIGSPADGYLLSYLPRVVGAKKAREIWMLCRRYNAQEALEMGLVNKVVPLDKLDEEVDQWCQEIMSLNPSCIMIAKASFDSDIDYMAGTLAKFQNMMSPEHFDREDVKEAMQAFFEKRQVDYGKTRGRPENWE